MTGRVLSVYSSHFQSSLGSLGIDLGIMPKFEANDFKGQNATAFHRVLSVLLRGVQEAHSLGGLITDVLGPDGLQQTQHSRYPFV
jgi:hypothetical protein